MSGLEVVLASLKLALLGRSERPLREYPLPDQPVGSPRAVHSF